MIVSREGKVAMYHIQPKKMPTHKNKIRALILLITLTIMCYIFGFLDQIYEKDFSEFDYPFSGDIRKSVLALKSGEIPELIPINHYPQKYLHNPENKCNDASSIRLLLMIKSSSQHFERREAIRASWGQEISTKVRRVFLLGSNEEAQERIQLEAEEYSDILQGDFEDVYFNNTIKTMLGYKWIVKYCTNVQYFAFVDDDYYVSVRNLLTYIKNPFKYPWLIDRDVRHMPGNKLYAGYVFATSPERSMFSKWYISLQEYPYNRWPRFVTGGACIISKNALLDMYFTSFYTKHFRFDDIYVAILAMRAEIEPMHNEQFRFYVQNYDASEYKFVIAAHGYDDSSRMLTVWREQKQLGNA